MNPTVRLPEPVRPFAQYRPVRWCGDVLYISGQVAAVDGEFPLRGRVGAELSIEEGRQAARQCALNLLAQIDRELGGFDRVEALVKVTVFVATAPDFLSHHVVADGASETFVQVLGPAGEHARSAVGVARLPMDSPVEVEAAVLVGPRKG
ncbi:Enamine deaminase RidA, house cleaning of reactive enamine intermediates, YjgF/YER057c/UK114 family [Nonomuraea pusilla]|uniref:Enamine deaminase RidA, house cleaning of reactive enamine intermediates, YjgF/YER057c/UK114 family n=1 Tax=Nonomuraea pusilla TaxID=46177 RepID=A0A1H7YBR5_9ACTN|nr:Enamine deaminase RidA, house cleaning of reactive enamine intermediates, YjgF/YER057c/UK114 family [Nonomuraea pusilla]